MALIKLEINGDKKFICPKCKCEMRRVEGGLKLKGGKVDMADSLPRYICDDCGVFYRELLNSGYYDVFDLPDEEKISKPKIKPVSEIHPTQLKREADGKCPCPRCGARMDFVEGGAVKIVDGKPDFTNTQEHFKCSTCNSIVRKIAGTNYFQYSEK